MSPEQLRAQEADTRSDIFSFGIILYEMVAGTHPFRRESSVEMSSAILKDVPPPLSRYREQVPELLVHVVKKMLAKDPDDRYQSVHEIRTDLADLSRVDSSRPVEVPIEVPAQAPAPTRQGRAFRWQAGVALVAVLAIVGTLAWQFGGKTPEALEDGGIASLAVLPLDNLMGDPEQQYFVDGMHDALITELSKIGALRVVSRTSVLRLGDDHKSLEEMADALQVDALIEGSIMKSANSVRITAQLVGVKPERHLWAENFEHELDDILALQTDVARAIAAEIKITLTPEEEVRLASQYQVPQEAHDSYLRGLYFSDQRGDEGMHKAQTALADAVALAPTWAPPYAALAELHLSRALIGNAPPSEALPKARAYALEALKLDNSLSSAHLVSAQISLAMEWDWAEAEGQVAKALELNPNSSSAREFYANVLLITGRVDQAVEELQKAIALEPLAHRYT
jgi:TolB-like protein